MKFLTSAQIRQAEENSERFGMNHLRLMENAGSAAARIIREKYSLGGKRITIVCGKGNNGGDGFVVARKLLENSLDVKLILASGIPVSNDASEMFTRLRAMGIGALDYPLETRLANELLRNSEIIVDAVFGTGFTGRPDETLSSLFRYINESSAKVISLDMPSGANCDTGTVEGECVRSDLTISFSAYKPGQALFPAAMYCENLIIAEIGMPEEAFENIKTNLFAVEMNDIREYFPTRDPRSHKGDFGRAGMLCGSRGMPGAAALAAKAALRCGAGLVDLAVPESLYPIIASSAHEPVFTPLPESSEGRVSFKAADSIYSALEKSTAFLVGCGLSQSLDISRIIQNIITRAKCPLIIDADGINSIVCDIDILKKANAPVILTPHPGEMAKILGIPVSQVQSSRLECARDFAVKYSVTVVLKGAHTVTASPDGSVFINLTGNPGMAAAGSGDVLAGMITAFAAQGIPIRHAAVSAVYIHGLAGDRAAERLSQRGLLPSDIIDEIPLILRDAES